MYVVGGTASKTVAEDLSKELNVNLAKVVSKRFPDDELYVRIMDDISGQDVIIVQTTYPDPNIIELFLLQNAVQEAGADKITVVLPYMGYGRQDKKFENGEPISAKALANLIGQNADRVITVDPHKEHILDFFSVSAFSCSAVPEIAKYLKEKDVNMVLAPDKGALDRAKQASKIIGCDFDYMEKTRIDGLTVKIKPKNLDAKDKKAAIIDDIISTGGTMAQSIKELKKQGAKQVLVACTHGLFAGDAIKKLVSAGCNEIISTDTIKSDFSKVKIAPCISRLLLSL
ncbi:MAG: ribose-phosphate diphosphokinase [Candidatus Thermoplasmatota archaeon]|jgi:ribose-phosphate pyrophosphokinase|nr:ribose-phosphate diphosphokinase [Candidatus Thermoplasmatota archaeon]